MMRSGIKELMEFGNHEHSLVGNLKNIYTAFSVILIWTIVVTVALTALAGVGTNEIRALLAAKIFSVTAPAAVQVSVFLNFFLACIFAPLWEELAYRYVPLGLAKSLEIILVRGFSHEIRRNLGVEYDYSRGHLFGSLKGTGFVLFAMLLSSIVFGLNHGSVINIMFQGVSGFIFAWLMIKSGYWSAVIAHSMWNFMLMFGMPVILK